MSLSDVIPVDDRIRMGEAIKELSPSLYDKILKILEPLAPFAGVAVEIIFGA